MTSGRINRNVYVLVHVGLAGRITRRDRYQSGLAYRLPFGIHRPNRGTPNYQGSHQIPSYGGPRWRNPHPSRTAIRRADLGANLAALCVFLPSARFHL